MHSSIAAMHPVTTTEETVAFQIQTNSGNSYGKPSYSKSKTQGFLSARGHNRVCSYGGRTNHTVETCFMKHGYPPGFKGKTKFQNSGNNVQSATAVTAASEISPHGSTSSSFGFTQEQYNNIIELLQKSKPNPQANSISISPFAMNSHSTTQNGKHINLWILDTSATDHISFDKTVFHTCFSIIPVHVNLPDGSHSTASMYSSVTVSPSLTLHNFLYVPNFHVNLISIAKLVNNNNCYVHFTTDTSQIMHNLSKAMIGTTRLQRGLYVLGSAPQPSTYNSITNYACNLWHYRLGHISDIGLNTVSKLFPFIPCTKNNKPCESFHFGKHKKLPFSNSNTQSWPPFKILHTDVWGPFSTISFLGHKYFLTLVDDYSRHTWTIFLKTKDQVKTSLMQFITYLDNQFKTFVKCLRTDNGTEFLTLSDFLLSKGITHQKSCVETPQQNGVVERKHQHILNVARTLYFHSNLPLNMWNFCIQHAIHLINRLPSPLLKMKSPHELLFSQPPSLIHLKVFGCSCFATTLQAHRTKFDPRARKCVFLGYKDATKGFILYDLHNHTTFVSRNVIFYENNFPLKNTQNTTNQHQPNTSSHFFLDDIPVIHHENDTPAGPVESITSTLSNIQHTEPITSSSHSPIHSTEMYSPMDNTQST